MKSSQSLYFLTLFTLLAIFPSCGAGGPAAIYSSSLPSEGRLIDSPVSNIYYESENFSGVTGLDGSFLCTPGGQISFYFRFLEDLIFIGKTPCRPIVSPIDLMTDGTFNIKSEFSELSSNEQILTIRTLRIFQSLDLDLNAWTGIELDDYSISRLVEYFYQSKQETTFIRDALTEVLSLSDDAFEDWISNLMHYIDRPGSQISAEAAISHFNEYRENCTKFTCTEY